MPETTVKFELRVPVAAPGLRESSELDARLHALRSIRGIAAVEAEWKYLPRHPPGEAPLLAHVEVAVRLTGANAASLRRLYSRLTREVSATPLSLAVRTCSLTDLFSDRA